MLGVLGVLLAIPTSTLSELFLRRGATQYLSLYLASATAAFVAVKAFRVLRIRRDLSSTQKNRSLAVLSGGREAIQATRERLRPLDSLPAIRRARVLDAYLASDQRDVAAARAEEDAAQAQEAMEQAYAIPRVMVWAIPLMGFIGTVIGISHAVSGFSGFLQGAEEIEQIKEGIGVVTTGLAVAFDTTLVALALSVVVMLLLVGVERLEAGFLLDVEADVADGVVARLPAGEAAAGVGAVQDAVQSAVRSIVPAEVERSIQATVPEAVQGAIAVHMPNPEHLIEPMRHFLEQAASGMTRFLEETREAERARDAAAGQALASQAEALAARAEMLAAPLRESAEALLRRAEALGELTRKTSELAALTGTLQRTTEAVHEAGDLRIAVQQVRVTLGELHPTLQRLAEPRQIMLVESSNGGAAR